MCQADVDHNCNGISGTDSQGRSYEDVLCANSQPRGIAVLGDSAAAKFHIPDMSGPVSPQQWAECFENEMDYPQCSWSTGHFSTAECPPSPKGMDSIYLRLWKRNHCNFRDYSVCLLGVHGLTECIVCFSERGSFLLNGTAYRKRCIPPQSEGGQSNDCILCFGRQRCMSLGLIYIV